MDDLNSTIADIYTYLISVEAQVNDLRERLVNVNAQLNELRAKIERGQHSNGSES